MSKLKNLSCIQEWVKQHYQSLEQLFTLRLKTFSIRYLFEAKVKAKTKECERYQQLNWRDSRAECYHLREETLSSTNDISNNHITFYRKWVWMIVLIQ